MSTKVYNVYKVKGDINSIMTHLHELRESIYKETEDLIDGFLENKLKDITWVNVMDIMIEDMKSGLNIITNPSASVVMYYVDGQYYLHYFSVREELLEPYINSGLISDYHYQNQVDPPPVEEVSEEEWEERKNFWDDMYDGPYDTPRTSGFTWELMTKSVVRHIFFSSKRVNLHTGEDK